MANVSWFKPLAGMVFLSVLIGCGGGGGGGQGQVNPGTSSSLSLDSVSSSDEKIQTVPFSTGQTVAQPSASGVSAAPYATNTSTTIAPYTPDQIRSAYQLPAYPASWSKLSAFEAAQLGSGQTIYIVDAYHDPKIVDELNAFSRQFNLPTCATSVIPVNATFPLAAADKTQCQLAVVYASQSGMTSTAPEYVLGWAQEIALDVEWAHAMAPLARIVLIEAPDNSVVNLMGAINLANAMGPGVVSMSFGSLEGSWVNSFDTAFNATDMTYVAATGDYGTTVNWPSVSSKVLAVGGTSLTGVQSGKRIETAWSKTGGGVSQYISIPDYQSKSTSVLGNLASLSKRNVADVAFNADPATGQYVATIDPSTSALTWYRFGGTSIAAPQWAGIVASTNAVRALNSEGPIGLVQNLLYKAAATTSSFFGSVLNDVTLGSNGYSAGSSYDIPTGLGTPNVQTFIDLAVGKKASSPPTTASPPSVSGISVTGQVESPLSFTLSYTASNAVTWDLIIPPVGMFIDSKSGLITWSKPTTPGTYSVNVRATDTVNKTEGIGVATVTIQPKSDRKLVISPISIRLQTGGTLGYLVPVISNYAIGQLTFTLQGNVPSGLTVDKEAGRLTWASAVQGKYEFVVIVSDASNQITGSALVHVEVTSAITQIGPVITAMDIKGQVDRPLNAFVGITDPGAQQIYVDISGAPAGMSYAPSGPGIMLRWRQPVAGTYRLVITAKDNRQLTSQRSVLVTVN